MSGTVPPAIVGSTATLSPDGTLSVIVVTATDQAGAPVTVYYDYPGATPPGYTAAQWLAQCQAEAQADVLNGLVALAAGQQVATDSLPTEAVNG